jgi:23S rRNA (cytidine1920-2'-O)/16S rRNA (cytidine1409-2'-O)-methyltransferase
VRAPAPAPRPAASPTVARPPKPAKMSSKISAKRRLDELLVERGLADNRTRARADVMAGRVRVAGNVVTKAGTLVAADAALECTPPPPYVGRGGLKLKAALDAFGIDPTDRAALDAGASTGGFTDCLLQHGARSVIAVDVGYGQLDPRLAADPRVTVLDRTNVRHLTPDKLPGPVDLLVADLSFISLRTVLPALKTLLAPGGEMVLLVKPQFEVGKGRVGKGGVVRDEALRQEAVDAVAEAAQRLGLEPRGRIPSPITGAKGNVEFLLHLKAADGEGPA